MRDGQAGLPFNKTEYERALRGVCGAFTLFSVLFRGFQGSPGASKGLQGPPGLQGQGVQALCHEKMWV